jgi:protein involved in polysaccharide export with SLBB domain
MKSLYIRAACVAALCHGLLAPVTAQQIRQSGPANATVAATAVEPALPTSFVIGVGDVLGVTFWRDQRMSGDVVVRPDGRISLPLLNDVQAAKYTPEELAGVLSKAAEKYIANPDPEWLL